MWVSRLTFEIFHYSTIGSLACSVDCSSSHHFFLFDIHSNKHSLRGQTINSMPRQDAGPSRSSLHPTPDERTPLVHNERRSNLSVTIESPARSSGSGSGPEDRDSYYGEEGDDDGREVEVYVPGKSTTLQTVSQQSTPVKKGHGLA